METVIQLPDQEVKQVNPVIIDFLDIRVKKQSLRLIIVNNLVFSIWVS